MLPLMRQVVISQMSNILLYPMLPLRQVVISQISVLSKS